MADYPCIVVKRCKSDLSCCGIVLDSTNGIVVTVGSLFWDLFPLNTQKSPSLVNVSLNDQFAVEVMIKVDRKSEEFRTLRGSAFLLWRDDGLHRLEERIFPSSEWNFESPEIGRTRTRDRESKSSVDVHVNEPRTQHNALSAFALIRVENLHNYLPCKAVNLATLRNSRKPQKGDTVIIVGTPFGSECPPVFYNSVTKGIVSNLVGGESEVIITDARCVPGCEGCPLYISSPTQTQTGVFSVAGSLPHAIVLAPFCWRNGEWIGITIACSLKYLISSLLELLRGNASLIPHKLRKELSDMCNLNLVIQHPTSTSVIQEEQRDMSPVVTISADQCSSSRCNILKDVFSTVVLVQHGGTWASGILVDVDEGLIVTCSHAVQEFADPDPSIVTGNCTGQLHVSSAAHVRVFLDFPNGIWQDAQILYATEKDFPLDFALLKIQNYSQLQAPKLRGFIDMFQRKTLKFTSSIYKSGEGVFVVGFPMFGSHLNIGPSIAKGVLSNVTYVDNQAVLLQSSAAVQCGSSGGALVSSETGELLGMVTSHTRDAGQLSTFPHINFSIPATLLCKLITAVKSNNVECHMKALVSDQMKNIWQLKHSLREDECQHVTSKL